MSQTDHNQSCIWCHNPWLNDRDKDGQGTIEMSSLVEIKAHTTMFVSLNQEKKTSLGMQFGCDSSMGTFCHVFFNLHPKHHKQKEENVERKKKP